MANSVAGAQQPPAEAGIGGVHRVAGGDLLRLEPQPLIADIGETAKLVVLPGRRGKVSWAMERNCPPTWTTA
jgi:hypothetical protein